MNFVILKKIFVINESKNGWSKELNLVQWNDQEPKYDIRWWPPEKNKAGKGVTFTLEELLELGNLINKLPRDSHFISS